MSPEERRTYINKVTLKGSFLQEFVGYKLKWKEVNLYKERGKGLYKKRHCK